MVGSPSESKVGLTGTQSDFSFPPLILREHQNVVVVRDDLFSYGSKARFLDEYFAGIQQDEVVYGSSPRWGFAQISVAFLAKRYSKKTTLFLPASNELSSYSLRAQELGAEIVQVPMGFLAVCEARAREHAARNGAKLLPCGLDCPSALDSIERLARSLDVKPDEVWTVASSGTLTRGLQRVFPQAEFFAVQVGKTLKQSSAGRAKVIQCLLSFGRKAKELPPFPSVPEYDAKAWSYIPKDGKKVRLFWNVGS